jgi:uncharacterized protein (DUF433 family)
MPIPNRIVLDPAVAHGRPIIRGTRLPVSIVVGSLAGGMTFEEVQREYNITARLSLPSWDALRSAGLPTQLPGW